MKAFFFARTLPRRGIFRFGFVVVGLVIALATEAQTTTFDLPTTFVNYETGTVVPASGHGGVFAVPSSAVYSDQSTATNGITPVTFGQSFTVEASGTSAAGTGAWGYQGNISGADIAAGSVIPISYDFTLANNGAITSDVSWTLYFRGGANGEIQIASGLLAAPTTSGVATSGTFSGNAASYDFVSGAVAGTDTYRAYIELSFTNNLGSMMQGILTVSMADTGFGGQGITLGASAVPEPSTYAALAGCCMLGVAMWSRRRPRRANPEAAMSGGA